MARLLTLSQQGKMTHGQVAGKTLKFCLEKWYDVLGIATGSRSSMIC